MLKSAVQAIPPVRKINLYCHFNDKEDLKNFNNVSFDKEAKKWFVNTDNPQLDAIIQDWSPVHLNVPYSSENINLLRTLNGLFDRDSKKWIISKKYLDQVNEEWL